MKASSARSRTVAFFLPSLCGGGAERVTLNLAHGIAERGIPVDLVVGTAEGAFAREVAESVRLVDLKAPRMLRSLGPLVRYLREARPRILVSSMSHANIVALWAARLARRGTPVMVTVHNTMSQSTAERGRMAGGLWPRLLRAFYPWASHVVAVSHGAAEDLARTLGVPRARVDVVYNPVISPEMLIRTHERPDHAWFAPGQPPVILGVGRLTPQKDFATLVRAFAELRRCRSVRLMILGEGEERPALQGLVHELGVDADVALPGFRDDVLRCMAASALFVLSSAWEGLPTVLIEALASGTRVVSTDCPSGPREILQDGRLGALVAVGDPTGMARAMQEALEGSTGAAPPEALRPFTRESAIDDYLRLIEST